ncbi:MAG TPA: hypothetical protein VI942_10300 [Thermoanaerobaculia bacterium]|nr:hypothetical protein [Thermoanaerobaculia bacterium]
MPITRGSTLAACCWLAALATAGAADDSSSALGYFESHGTRLPITDSYAFPGTSSLGEEGVVVVAVSNAGFVQSELDQYWDRRYVLDNFFEDDETGVVYFELDPDGRYRGLSYYFGPGDGCGYCSGGVESSVKRVGDRFVGTLRQSDSGDGRAFEITIDVPVSSSDYGAPQGEGGGAPGTTYLAYNAALDGSEAAALRELVSAERRATWAEAESEGQAERFLAYLREGHPQTIRVVQAYVRGERALVLYEGENAYSKIRGEALLVLEDGVWRFEEETIQTVLH